MTPIGTGSFLAVANIFNGSPYKPNSRIYKWDGVSFVEFQSIPTNGTADWEPFAVGMDHYLIVANRQSDLSCTVDSEIFIGVLEQAKSPFFALTPFSPWAWQDPSCTVPRSSVAGMNGNGLCPPFTTATILWSSSWVRYF